MVDRISSETHRCPYCRKSLSWRIMFKRKRFKCPSCERKLESNRKEVLNKSVLLGLIACILSFTIVEIIFHVKMDAAAEGFKIAAYVGLFTGYISHLCIMSKNIKIRPVNVPAKI